MGAVILLDKLFSHASSYLVDGDVERYYDTLEAIYIELEYWIKKKKLTDLQDLNNIRTTLRTRFNDITLLKIYHSMLNSSANKAGLRLKSSSGTPGVLST